jgi:energy-coupling factor transporter transmembrane protein EcfT
MKIIYWSSTILISAFLTLSAYSYLFSKNTIDGFRDLGFPDFFRIQLAVLKIIAVPLLLIPMIPIQMKEWTYAGVGLFLITAIVAHLKHKDSYAILVVLFALLVILVLSNIYFSKIYN